MRLLPQSTKACEGGSNRSYGFPKQPWQAQHQNQPICISCADVQSRAVMSVGSRIQNSHRREDEPSYSLCSRTRSPRLTIMCTSGHTQTVPWPRIYTLSPPDFLRNHPPPPSPLSLTISRVPSCASYYRGGEYTRSELYRPLKIWC